ncbi:hypothetical protein ACTXG7_14145 [Mycolicibacterium sp. Dal123E01]|uniref:hypothetical protein n=1 Tax=Mycolicibacterium sp. Dal123E01 TaxID=3457578 RepID=UPI00403ED345
MDRDGWQLRYAHWAGCRLLDALIAGPAMAKSYILAQQDGEFWTDELWADGGLVLDLVERRLVFFGEEIMTTMNERRAIFEVLAILWPGYSISWAYDATAEIAAYVHHDLLVRDEPSQPELILAEDTSRLHHLVTVVGDDGAFRAWPLWWGSSGAWRGPQLVDMLPGVGRSTLSLHTIPESGIHVDVPDMTLGVWLTNPIPGLFRWLPQLWPGWHIDCWDDRYEEHLFRCGPAITALELDIISGVDVAESWLRRRVFQSYVESPAGELRSLATLFGMSEADPEVGEAGIFRMGEQPTGREWARFEHACAQVRAGLSAA